MTIPLRLTKRERIKLLLRTRQDALEAQAELGGGELGSRSPSHSQLWYDGSYPALELCLDFLAATQPRIRWHLVNFYAPSKVWKPGLKPRKGYADLGLDWLEQRLENVYVPASVSENAGYLPSEAARYAKPRSLRRAA